MKKWIIIVTVFIIFSITVVINIYLNALEPKEQNKLFAERIALEEAGIVTVEEFYQYHGNETYFAITGKNQSNEDYVVWIPKNKKSKVMIKKANKGLTKQEAINIVVSEKKPEKIISVSLGMENNIPIWEISCLNKKNRLDYYYLQFETGEYYRIIENL